MIQELYIASRFHQRINVPSLHSHLMSNTIMVSINSFSFIVATFVLSIQTVSSRPHWQSNSDVELSISSTSGRRKCSLTLISETSLTHFSSRNYQRNHAKCTSIPGCTLRTASHRKLALDATQSASIQPVVYDC